MTTLNLEFRNPYIYYQVTTQEEANDILRRAAQYGAMVVVDVVKNESDEDDQC